MLLKKKNDKASSSQLFFMVFASRLFLLLLISFGGRSAASSRNFALCTLLSSAVGLAAGYIAIKYKGNLTDRRLPLCILSVCFVVEALLSLRGLLAFFSYVYNDFPIIVSGAVVVSVVIYAAKSGLQATARLAYAVIPLIMAAFVLFALFNSVSLNGGNLSPALFELDTGALLSGLSFTEAAAYIVTAKKIDIKNRLGFYAGITAANALTAIGFFLFADLLIPALANYGRYSFYIVAVAGNDLILKNFEYAYLFILSICGLIRMALLLISARIAFAANQNKKKNITAECAAVLISSFIAAAAAMIFKIELEVSSAILGALAMTAILIWGKRSEN